jgi:tetratricopeptide (TPR) repeat protein
MTGPMAHPTGSAAVSAFEEAALAAALLGDGLTDDAAEALRNAGECYGDSQAAEGYLSEASRLAPDHAAVLIGLYRYYFYKGRLQEALAIACQCLLKAARDNGFSTDWHCVRAEDAPFGSYDARLPRFYLFTLKAYAYLQLRLADYAEGRDAVLKLLELDPSDKVNARLLLDVLQRAELDHE